MARKNVTMPKALLYFFLILPLSAEQIKVYALKYGESLFPAHKIDIKQPKNKLFPFVWLMYLVRIERADFTENILIDTGFTQKGYARPNGVKKLRTAKQLLKGLRLKPGNIHKVVLTHTHFDHLGGLHQFQNATVYLQKKEFDWFSRKPYSKSFLKMLKDFRKRGKIKWSSINYRLNSYIHLKRIGAHTPGSQSVLIKTQKKSIFLIGDDCYYIKTCEIGRSSAVISSKSRLRRLQHFIHKRRNQGNFSIKTFHDPKVLKGAKKIGDGIYQIY